MHSGVIFFSQELNFILDTYMLSIHSTDVTESL